jgi:hypothetical protein
MTATAPSTPRATLGKWLLRIFLASFLFAVAAPVVIAVAIFHVSSETRALRNAAIHGDGLKWHKQIEVSAGALPFTAVRLIAPFTHAPKEALQALEALRSAEISVHELRHDTPDRARALKDADESMRNLGWDRVATVLDHHTAVAVYVIPESGSGGNIKAAVLVLDGKQMVAVSGRAKLEPIFDLALQKAEDEILPKRPQPRPIVAAFRRD